jgi:Actinobacteria/chloroflexi VLRF1 release factor
VVQSRTVDIGPERIERWLHGFAERHGALVVTPVADTVHLTAVDGATADLASAFEPLPAGWADVDPLAAFISHAMRPRVVAILLVRLGGYAAGVFDGDEIVGTKVGARLVHGRSAAGGWSQQRFARRREGQVKVALDAAANNAVNVFLPRLPAIECVVTGGDRQALRTVLADTRLAALRPLVSARVLDVPDPRARVLRDSVRAARAIRVTLVETAEPG